MASAKKWMIAALAGFLLSFETGSPWEPSPFVFAFASVAWFVIAVQGVRFISFFGWFPPLLRKADEEEIARAQAKANALAEKGRSMFAYNQFVRYDLASRRLRQAYRSAHFFGVDLDTMKFL